MIKSTLEECDWVAGNRRKEFKRYLGDSQLYVTDHMEKEIGKDTEERSPACITGLNGGLPRTEEPWRGRGTITVFDFRLNLSGSRGEQ